MKSSTDAKESITVAPSVPGIHVELFKNLGQLVTDPLAQGNARLAASGERDDRDCDCNDCACG